VSSVPQLSEGLFLTSEVECFEERRAIDAFLGLQRAARVTRTWGDAYGYLLVATGRAVVMVDAVVALWDVAAVQPVVEEAGGTLTDWKGNRSIYAGEAIGTNGAVLDEVLAITRPFST
jgi:fructose-1,6-bisphosphatase/inositol monophosphatase family enzyme